jgi:hypothetical protein
MSAFRRLEADGVISQEERDAHAKALESQWIPSYAVMQATNHMGRFAGKLVFRHSLRGFDAVHLAAAIVLRVRVLGSPDAEEGSSVQMLTYDRRQREAARAESILYESEEDKGTENRS